MKKVRMIITIIITIFICSYNVNAKDTLYSINKYKEENFDYITSSYNKKGNIDGQILAGSYLEESKSTNEEKSENQEDYQIILVKYNQEGKKVWDFSYDKNSSDSIDYLTYSYDKQGQVDGYLVAMKTTGDKENETLKEEGLFLKIDLSGKLIWEKANKISSYIKINKIIPTFNDNQEFDGYVAIATYKNSTSSSNAIIIRYDKDYNIIWNKKRPAAKDKEVYYSDLINIYEENKVIGYAVIENETQEAEINSKLLKFTKSGESQILLDTLEKYESSNLKETKNGYIIFGLTKDVKVKNGDYSYYILNYDSKNNQLWETVGETAVSNKGPIKLLYNTLKKDIIEYLLMYQNAADESIEVIKFDQEGVFLSKIKKINNDYYTVNDFQAYKDVLYFIGHISCPEDDSCNYKTNSLFLVSTEDKVIEVKDNDSKSILFTVIIIVFLIGMVILYKNKRNK